jgi:hypothetical protein
MASLTIEEHRSRLDEIRTAIKELDTEYAGQVLPDEKRAEWNKLNDELETVEKTVEELEARADRIASLSRDGKTEEGADRGQIRTNAGSTRGGDIYDLTSLRSMPPEEQKQELRDRALRSVEKARFGGEGIGSEPKNREQFQGHISDLLDREFEREQLGHTVDDSVSRRILVTGSPIYRRALAKYVAGRGYALTGEEQRALSVGTGSAGGFAIVYQLDPTMVPTSNYSINPFRAISRNVQLTGTNEWKALTSGAITAAYAAEATQAGQRSDARTAGHHRGEGAGVRSVLDRARRGLGSAPGRDGAGPVGREGRPRGDEVRARCRPRVDGAEGHHHGGDGNDDRRRFGCVRDRRPLQGVRGASGAVSAARSVGVEPVHDRQGPPVRHGGRLGRVARQHGPERDARARPGG